MQGRFRKEHRSDASVSAMCVNWRGGAVGGHPLTVNPAYLTAEAGGGTVDEIPETQGIGLCTPSFGAGHTPRVMVEIDAVKTVVVHHVGVQPPSAPWLMSSKNTPYSRPLV